MKRWLLASLLLAALSAAPQTAQAHDKYDRDDSDHPLRYVAYVLHPFGVAVEVAILRPIHKYVTKPLASKIHGHEPNVGADHAMHSHGPTTMATAQATEPKPVVPTVVEQPATQTRPVTVAPTPAPTPVAEQTTPIRETQDAQGSTRLEVLSELLFDSGSAALTDDGKQVLDQLATRVRQFPSDRPIMVEGYTDTDPIVYSGWPSNWHLGAARAIAVLQYINGQGIAPARCGATTYSEYRPVEPNATPEGKTKNRRVVVLIMAEGATAPAEGETLVSRGVYRLPRDLGGAQ